MISARERVTANLYKLVNVIQVEDLTAQPTVSRDLALIKVSATPDNRTEIMQMVDVFRARIVDVTNDSLDHRDHRRRRQDRGLCRCSAPVRHHRDGAHRRRRHGARREPRCT